MTAQIRSKELSPVELIEAHLSQIERQNPRLNAFVTVLAEEARSAARAAEGRQMRGELLGPLDGIPVTVKDSFDMAGLKTHCGSRFLGLNPAAEDAVSVARLRAAGAIPIGKTNCPEFLASYETDNFVTGRTNSPWDLERTPGGSSGGESEAISAFCSAGGIGSDGGGSIRVPAHFAGIAGLKPTPGRCPAAGHVPAINHPGGLLGVGGPMARDVAAVRTLFEVLAGHDTDDPFSAPVTLREWNADGVRIGLMEQFYRVPVQPAIKAAVRKAGETLAGLGFRVEPFEPKGIERSPNLWWLFFGILPVPFTRELIAGREDEVHFTGIEFFRQASE
ncbi:MAG TPA: amidase family protein, partial [Bryobacteraceae bacterium]|nr:amidase family protein [Bryobacteraceae bacterium]